MHKTQSGWIEEYKKLGALWVHDGNIKRPHVRLHKGGHSDVFFNSEGVMEYSLLLEMACFDLVQKLTEAVSPPRNWTDEELTIRVIGPAMGAITLADGIARNLSRQHTIRCKRGFTVKDDDGKQMFDRTKIEPDEYIIPVEDVFTTGDTVSQTITLCEKQGAWLAQYILVLVNRSGLQEINGRRIISLVDLPSNNYEPDKCPLCAEGSEALYPAKAPENWARLTAVY